MFAQTGVLGFIVVDKATQPARRWLSVPAVIVGTLDSADEIPRRLGLHKHQGSAPGALPAGLDSGWDLSTFPTPRGGCCSRFFFSAQKAPPSCQALGARSGLWVLLLPPPFLVSGRDGPKESRRVKERQGVGFGSMLGTLAVRPS